MVKRKLFSTFKSFLAANWQTRKAKEQITMSWVKKFRANASLAKAIFLKTEDRAAEFLLEKYLTHVMVLSFRDLKLLITSQSKEEVNLASRHQISQCQAQQKSSAAQRVRKKIKLHLKSPSVLIALQWTLTVLRPLPTTKTTGYSQRPYSHPNLKSSKPIVQRTKKSPLPTILAFLFTER